MPPSKLQIPVPSGKVSCEFSYTRLDIRARAEGEPLSIKTVPCPTFTFTTTTPLRVVRCRP